MNPAPLPRPANSSSTQKPLRAGQIPTEHDVLALEQVQSLGQSLEASLATLERRYAEYVTVVSTKNSGRR